MPPSSSEPGGAGSGGAGSGGAGSGGTGSGGAGSGGAGSGGTTRVIRNHLYHTAAPMTKTTTTGTTTEMITVTSAPLTNVDDGGSVMLHVDPANPELQVHRQ